MYKLIVLSFQGTPLSLIFSSRERWEARVEQRYMRYTLIKTNYVIISSHNVVGV